MQIINNKKIQLISGGSKPGKQLTVYYTADENNIIKNFEMTYQSSKPCSVNEEHHYRDMLEQGLQSLTVCSSS
jgi:hypothetical protein